ncbi:MAG: transporter [Gemmatimonadota bacterium]
MQPRRPLLTLSSLLLLGGAAPALGQEPSPGVRTDADPLRPASDLAAAVEELVTDRPDVTESAATVGGGVIQVESGVSLERSDGTHVLSGPATLVRVGVASRIEGRLAWDGWVDGPDGSSGAGDGELGLKLALLSGRARGPDLSLLAATSVPLGQDPISSGSVDPSFKAIAALELRDGVSLGINAGIAWFDAEQFQVPIPQNAAIGAGLPVTDPSVTVVRATRLSWSASVGFDLGERTGAFVELFAEHPEYESDVHALDAGITFLLSPDLQLDASAGTNLASAGLEWFIGSGVSLRAGPW